MKFIITPDNSDLYSKIYTFETPRDINSDTHPIINFLIKEEMILVYKKNYYSVFCQITTNFEFLPGFKYGAICLIIIEESVLYLETYFNFLFKRPSDYKILIDNYSDNFDRYPKNGRIYKNRFLIGVL